MYRILFEVGDRPIYTYGVMMALGILVGVTIAWLLARREGRFKDEVLDFSVWMVIGGIVGARIAYVLPRLELFTDSPLSLFAIWEGGLAIQGGIIGGLVVGIIFTKVKKIPFWQFADIWAPALLVGQALGRIGCYFNGCCFGVPTGGGWGLVFPEDTGAFQSFGSQALYPTQLMEFGWDIALCAVLLLIWKRRPFDGFIFTLYAAGWSLGTTLIRFLRGDVPLGVAGLTDGQIIGFLATALALVVMAVLFRRSKKRPDEPASGAAGTGKAGNKGGGRPHGGGGNKSFGRR